MKASDIIEMRKRLGWTQAQLAERIGTTQATICRYEKGAVKISRMALLSLERVRLEADGASTS